MANKVQFNLKNVAYATLVENQSSSGLVSVSYGDVKRVNGAVSVDLAQDGEMTDFYADGGKYYVTRSNQGYSGSLEMALIPDSMLVDIFDMKEDEEGVLFDNANDVPRDFALMFQIDGDVEETYYCFYKCSASRPSITSRTNEESKEPQTMTLELSVSPMLDDGKIMAKATAENMNADDWYANPYGYDQGGDA